MSGNFSRKPASIVSLYGRMHDRHLSLVIFRFADNDLNILTQCGQKTEQTINGEPVDRTTNDVGNLWLGYAQQFSNLFLLQTTLLDDTANRDGRFGLDHLLIRIFKAKVFKYIASAGFLTRQDTSGTINTTY